MSQQRLLIYSFGCMRHFSLCYFRHVFFFHGDSISLIRGYGIRHAERMFQFAEAQVRVSEFLFVYLNSVWILVY